MRSCRPRGSPHAVNRRAGIGFDHARRMLAGRPGRPARARGAARLHASALLARKPVCHTSAASPDLRRVPTRIAPLAIAAFTATSALGHGRGAHAERCARDRGGLEAERFHARAAGLRDRSRRRPRDRAAAGRVRRVRLPQQSPSLARACIADGFLDAARARSSATAPIASRSSSAHRRRASARPKKAIASSTAAPARAPAPAGAAHAAFARAVSRSRARHARAVPHRRDRVLVERQDVRQGRAHDPARHRRCGDPRRRRHAVRQRAVRIQCAGARCAGAVPAVRYRRATASRSAKRPVSRCSSATAMRARRA